MRLKRLSLKNFKGIKSFELDTGEKDVDIYGDNSTGKSTLFDSVTWLLFNKDSLNSANFDIKTLKPDGQPIHKLEHSVEAVFDMGSSEMTLRKVYYEKYTKKRGTASREFTGHNTDHFIDGVPVSMTEYKNQINDICDETLFKLLSNPRYFNEVLHWQERRTMLLEICGDITDEDVITSNDKLKDLPDILKKRKLEDHRKVIASRRAEINKELDKIPVRIDEISSSAVEVRNKPEIEKDLAGAQEEKKTAEDVLKEIKAGGESEVLTTELRKIENQIRNLENQEAARNLKARQAQADERQKLWRTVEDIQYSIELIEKDQLQRVSNIKAIKNRIDVYNQEIEQFRKDWYEKDSTKFEFEQSDKCPSCGQDLPKEELETARKKAEESFNKTKSEKLVSIDNKGKSLTNSAALEKKDLQTANDQIKDFNETLDGLKKKLPEAEDALRTFDEQETKDPDNPERIDLSRSKEEIEKQIQDKKGSVDPAATAEGNSQIEAINIRIKAYEKELLQIEANARIDVRVKELSDQERTLSAEFEELERQLYLADQFIRTKVSMLEQKINSRFKLARFKLFDEQINQGLSETCVVISNGVPYPSMNNAARINIGLDICNTLSEHFGKEIPIWIDNKEAVSELLDTKSQQIRLIVSADDLKLRVEKKE